MIAKGLLVVVSGAAFIAQAGLERSVGQHEGHELAIRVPLVTARAFEDAMMRVASASGVPFGLELIADEPPSSRIRTASRGSRTLRLTGMALRDALNALQAGVPPPDSGVPYASVGVSWWDAGGIVHVSSLRSATFLDSVQSFRVANEDLGTCFQRIHRLFDPDYPVGRTDIRRSVLLPSDSAAAAARVAAIEADKKRRISLELENVTVRTILDRLVMAHGRASWSVVYTDVSGEYSASLIGYRFFSGNGLTLSANRR